MSGMKRPLGAKPKPSVADLFGGDSSDEEDTKQDVKKAKGVAGASNGPRPPSDKDVREAAEKLAGEVARSGRSLESIARGQYGRRTVFGFLHETSGNDYRYYDEKVREIEASLGKPPSSSVAVAAAAGELVSSRAPVPEAPPPPWRSSSNPASHQQQLQTARLLAPPSNSDAPEEIRAKSAMQKGNSLEAMEAYASLITRRKDRSATPEDAPGAGSGSGADEDAGPSDRPPAKHLNATAYDRRKVVAVFRNDGSRGHHMQDFIPPEEMAKLLAKQKADPVAAEQAKAIEEKIAIQKDNIGHKLLSKMGWKEGEGVGAQKSGITAPVQASGVKQDNLGLGATAVHEVTQEDDPFEAYRKRMMLGYKYRPNPLGNPRKAYY